MCAVFRTLLTLSVLVASSESYNILVVFPHYGKSHFFLYEGVLKTLTSRGHNLTVISYFPQKHPVPNYRDIPLNLNNENSTGGLAFNDIMHSRFQSYGGLFILKQYMEQYCKVGLEDENFRKFLKEKNDFDLILFQIFTSECFMGIIKKYNAPVIGNVFF